MTLPFCKGFGTLNSTSGEEVRLDELAEDEAYINDKAAEELEAEPGDELLIFVAGEALSSK